MLHLAAHAPWPHIKTLAESNAWALLPVGSTEAHGPHLPLNVDVVIAREVCRRVGQQVEAVEFPAVSYSLTEFAASFAGTISIEASLAHAHLVAIIRGIGKAGFNRIAIINHHLEPAHFRLVHAAAAEAQESASFRVVVPDHRRKPTGPLLGDEFMHGGSHAGTYETSLMLAAAPEMVEDEVRRALRPVLVDLPEVIRAGATNFVEAGGPEAYFGSPAQASAEEGERLFGVLTFATLAAMAEARV